MTQRPSTPSPALAVTALAIGMAWSGAAAAQVAPYGRMIVFGDSISDGGAYADKAPEGAGRFTTNPDKVWVEHMATAWGLPLTSSAAGGLNYAEGGARVAEPRHGAPGDLTRLPVVDQIEDFLASDAFRSDDLVVIQGGGNDVFHTQTNGLDFTPADLEVLEAAAGDLAGALADLEAAGARWILTTSVPEFEAFNAYYRDAVREAGVNVLFFDAARLIEELKSDPSTYGLVNIVDPACRGSGVQSFQCLPEDLVTPDANRTYLMADRVHFTGAVHEMKAQAALSLVDAVHQVDATVRLIDASRPAGSDWLAPVEGRAFTGAMEGRRVGTEGVREGEADISTLRLGLTRKVGGVGLGLGVNVEDAEGDIAGGAGLDWRSVGVAAVAERQAGPLRVRMEGGLSALEDVALTRQFDIGPATREEAGTTSGNAASAALTLSWAVGGAGLRLEPWTSLSWTRTRLDGWTEAGDASTAAAFGDLTHDMTEAGLGLRAAFGEIGGGWTPQASFAVHTRLAGDEAQVLLTPVGAPAAFAAPISETDGARTRLEAGLSRPLGRDGRVSLTGVWTPTGPWDETGLRLQASRSF